MEDPLGGVCLGDGAANHHGTGGVGEEKAGDLDEGTDDGGRFVAALGSVGVFEIENADESVTARDGTVVEMGGVRFGGCGGEVETSEEPFGEFGLGEGSADGERLCGGIGGEVADLADRADDGGGFGDVRRVLDLLEGEGALDGLGEGGERGKGEKGNQLHRGATSHR